MPATTVCNEESLLATFKTARKKITYFFTEKDYKNTF